MRLETNELPTCTVAHAANKKAQESFIVQKKPYRIKELCRQKDDEWDCHEHA